VLILKNSVHPFIDENFFYYTGLCQGIFEDTYALFYPDGHCDILVSQLEAESAGQACATLHVYTSKEELMKVLHNQLSSKKTVGLNFNGLVLKDYLHLQTMFPQHMLLDVSKELLQQRQRKDVTEIELIKKACAISDSVMKKIPEFLTEEMKEYELAAEINHLMQKKGADKPAFDTISSFGPHTAQPHYSHGNTTLHKGSFVLCDFGACYHKYNSDITRTFFYGKADEKHYQMYETVKEAQCIGFDLMYDGAKGSDVHKAVQTHIDKSPFKGHFIHSTGHSLGMAVHDGLRISAENETLLQENMIFTVEPGIYLPNIGGVRIEDDILIKKEGIELLTHAPKEFIEIR